MFTSRHAENFFKLIVNFTGKHLSWSLIIWLSCRYQISNCIKKRLQHRLFPVKFAKFLSAPCFTEHLQWRHLKVSGFQPATLLKKRLRNRCFAVNLANFLKTSFLLTEHLPMTASCVYLWILRRFSEHFFYRVPWGNRLFYVQVAEFQPPDTIKNYFTGAFYEGVCEGVDLLWSCEMPRGWCQPAS